MRARLVAPPQANSDDDEYDEGRDDESQASLQCVSVDATLAKKKSPTFSIGNCPSPASLPSNLAFFSTFLSYLA